MGYICTLSIWHAKNIVTGRKPRFESNRKLLERCEGWKLKPLIDLARAIIIVWQYFPRRKIDKLTRWVLTVQNGNGRYYLWYDNYNIISWYLWYLVDIDIAPSRKSADVWDKFARSRKDANSGWWRSAMQECRVFRNGWKSMLKFVKVIFREKFPNQQLHWPALYPQQQWPRRRR